MTVFPLSSTSPQKVFLSRLPSPLQLFPPCSVQTLKTPFCGGQFALGLTSRSARHIFPRSLGFRGACVFRCVHPSKSGQAPRAVLRAGPSPSHSSPFRCSRKLAPSDCGSPLVRPGTRFHLFLFALTSSFHSNVPII